MVLRKDIKRYMELNDLEKAACSFDINQLLKKKGFMNIPLDFDEAYILGTFVLSTLVPELENLFPLPRDIRLRQSIAALVKFHDQALYSRRGSEEQIAGICTAVFDYDIGTSEFGFVDPGVEVIDNCGMGGDLVRTPNLSTIAALIAAAGGVKMLKHGSPGNTDNVGSSDFLARSGVELFADKGLVEEGVKKLNFAYTEALDTRYKRIHLQTHEFSMLAHMNDIIGPITNPVQPGYMKKRIIGINHLLEPRVIAEAYDVLNRMGITDVRQGLFVRGFSDASRAGGIDEVSTTAGGTKVAELKEGVIRSYDLEPADFGLEPSSVEALDPGDDKAGLSLRILQGKVYDARLDAVLANAAMLFYLADGTDLKQGVKKARELLKSGRPYDILQEYAALSHSRDCDGDADDDGGIAKYISGGKEDESDRYDTSDDSSRLSSAQ
ncbi:hypothetical protein KY362_06995 [Candidatus Woesearchaeota archaeon]|nr:hypothetical protein [Candidatus Woesearchaeota archaeon]